MGAQTWLNRRDHGTGITELQLGKGPDNGLTTEFLKSFEDEIISLGAEDAVNAIILSSPFAAFCSGTASDQNPDCAEFQAQLTSTFQTLASCGKPTIAAVNGNAHGAGLLFVVCCDIGIGRSRTTYRFDGVTGGTMLPQQIIDMLKYRLGYTVCRRILPTGQELGPIAARNYGLLDILAEDQEDLWLYSLREAKARVHFDASRYASLKEQLG